MPHRYNRSFVGRRLIIDSKRKRAQKSWGKVRKNVRNIGRKGRLARYRAALMMLRRKGVPSELSNVIVRWMRQKEGRSKVRRR